MFGNLQLAWRPLRNSGHPAIPFHNADESGKYNFELDEQDFGFEILALVTAGDTSHEITLKRYYIGAIATRKNHDGQVVRAVFTSHGPRVLCENDCCLG